MPPVLQLQKLPGKGDVSFFAEQKIASSWGKKCVLGHAIASYSTSNKLLLVARHFLCASKNAFKFGSVKFANSLSPLSIVKKVRTGNKSSQGT